LDKLIFLSKNWSIILGWVVNPLLIWQILLRDLNLEKKLEEFEGAFERDEVVEL
jgi:hypothetical protein